MITPEQKARLLELRAMPAPLSDKLARKFAKLQALDAATAAAAAGSNKRPRDAADGDGPARAKATSTGADVTLRCCACAADFAFPAAEQLAYADAGWYVPSRCADCAAAKKERFDALAAKRERAAGGVAPPTTRCFNCGGSGHLAADCPRPRASAHAPKTCYHCGSDQHLSRACTRAVKAPRAAAPLKTRCFNCGGTGHERAACPQPPARPICFNCGLDVGSDDHPLRNCPQPKRTSGVCYAHAHGRCDRKNCKFEHGGGA